MPNWVDTSWNVTLPTDKVQRFLNYFLTSDQVDELRGRFLFRTFIVKDSIDIVETAPGISHIAFVSDSAWSLESILIERDPSETGGRLCPTLQWICEDCGVEFLEAVGDEPNMGFREHIDWDPDGGLSHWSEDLDTWCCNKCNTFGYWQDQAPDVDKSICPSCKEKFEEEEDE